MCRPAILCVTALAVIAGAVLALPYIAYARRTRRPRTVYGVGLIVAAAVYIVFAASAGDLRAAALETGGLALFGLIAVIGMRRSLPLLAFGWGAHVLWDLLLHPVKFSGYAPWWYALVCLGFDVVVALDILYQSFHIDSHGTSTRVR